MKRRQFLKLSTLFGISSLSTSDAISKHSSISGAMNARLHPTPQETAGPFYPQIAQDDKDFDLTKVKGKNGVAYGTHIYIEGVVIDIKGNKLKDATVDVWQANSHGKYRHPHDSSNAPLDKYFQGWAILRTNDSGSFRFKTVMPGAYKISNTWQRPPHIHFKVSKQGYEELITQMYFPEHRLNATDRLLQKKTPEEQAMMISNKSHEKQLSLDVYQYQIILRKL